MDHATGTLRMLEEQKLEISEVERYINALFDYDEPEKPLVTTARIGPGAQKESLALVWWSDDDGKRHLYELMVSCPEAELMAPWEWDVIFLGSIDSLRQSEITSRMQTLPTGGTETIAILVVNKMLYDLKGRDMRNFFFPSPVIIIIEPGQNRLALPRPYIRAGWQPTADPPLNLPQEFIAKCSF